MTKTKQKQTKKSNPQQKDAQERQCMGREELFCQGKVLGKTNAESYLSACYNAKKQSVGKYTGEQIVKKSIYSGAAGRSKGRGC
jgi:hypothetical protein